MVPNKPRPALERVAQNPSLHDKHLERFNRDEASRDMSLSEDKNEGVLLDFPASACAERALLDELKDLLDQPLDDFETDLAAWTLEGELRIYCPGARYDMELKHETDRVTRWAAVEASNDTRQYFVQWGPASEGHAGPERVNIIARRNIRRRWEKLGVWNPAWGIPGRTNPQPNDETRTWKWPWQHGEAAAEWRSGKPMLVNSRHPSVRALKLYRGRRRSEYAVVSPCSRLDDDASASRAESFIISRPWFMFAVKTSEAMQRHDRLPDEIGRDWNSPSEDVKELWKERGDWKAGWQDPRGGKDGKVFIGWNWPHESPEPDPEDLSCLEDLATLELTPSEVEALEAVRPPSPPPAPSP